MNTSPFETMDAEALPWDTECLWVADKAWLFTADNKPAPATGLVALKREDGVKVALDRIELDARYFSVEDGEAWKPRYAPKKAYTVKYPTKFKTPDGKVIAVSAGGALLRDDRGYSAASPEDYAACYTVVGHADAPRPTAPFAYLD